ncbi:hypothetical protein Vadar_000454 [Vaccinium darrowii]|uniref:Uncharacterized protein n=1 Tax=Vaccinium darrowii TaxID=229202 RepID=A0ACB7X6K3_9ERIC|nr:hypothetical protein Vadar_000454 [Vaccinium darrowii]
MPVKRSLPSPHVESADGSGSEWRAAPKKRPGRVVEKRVESSPPWIPRLPSPVQESVGSSKRELVEDFLHWCYHCKRKINYRKDVYMYRDLRFCTVECRGMQMAADEMEEASRKLKRMQLGPTK